MAAQRVDTRGRQVVIVGSGMLAKAFATFADVRDVCIYAAGVSNSGCAEAREFDRERQRVEKALHEHADADAFVYFSTCSIDDPGASGSHYVHHKLRMESLVAAHGRHLIVRLPQVAGRTPNPHTLLNYLHARVSRSEGFVAWTNATRNVIDVADVANVVGHVVSESQRRAETINVANPGNVTVGKIVAELETVLKKRAVVQWVDAGTRYDIDVRSVLPFYDALGTSFDPDYLRRVITKYYGS